MSQRIIHLSPGDVAGFDIGTRSPTNRQLYDPRPGGLLFVGDNSFIRPYGWGSDTIHIERGSGPISFNGCTIQASGATNGKGKGIHYGTSKEYGNAGIMEHDALILNGCHSFAPAPAPGRQHSAVWGVMTYNTDIHLEDCTFDYFFSAEHTGYSHGFAKYGLAIKRCQFQASGGEGWKVATRPEEVWFAPEAEISVSGSEFRNWYQPWSWRGGAGLVLQGSGARKISLDDVGFFGGDGQRSKCLMIDDGGQRYYDHEGVVRGPGAANGHVDINRCGFNGVGTEWYTSIVKVDTIDRFNPVDHKNALSFKMRGSGVYGERTFLNVNGVDTVSVKGCNTPAIKRYGDAHGFNTLHETQLKIEQQPLVPVSQGTA